MKDGTKSIVTIDSKDVQCETSKALTESMVNTECASGENFHRLSFDFKIHRSKTLPDNIEKLQSQAKLVCDRISSNYNYSGGYNYIMGLNGDDFIKNKVTLRIEAEY